MDRLQHSWSKGNPFLVLRRVKLNVCSSLKPNTKYRFRLASQNDMGISDHSRSTNYIRTKENSKTEMSDNDLLTFFSHSSINHTRNCPPID